MKIKLSNAIFSLKKTITCLLKITLIKIDSPLSITCFLFHSLLTMAPSSKPATFLTPNKYLYSWGST